MLDALDKLPPYVSFWAESSPSWSALFRCIAECCTLSHAQIIDSTYILAVDRRVQEIDAAKDHGIRTLENEEFLEQMSDGGGALKGFVKNGQLVQAE